MFQSEWRLIAQKKNQLLLPSSESLIDVLDLLQTPPQSVSRSIPSNPVICTYMLSEGLDMKRFTTRVTEIELQDPGEHVDCPILATGKNGLPEDRGTSTEVLTCWESAQQQALRGPSPDASIEIVGLCVKAEDASVGM